MRTKISSAIVVLLSMLMALSFVVPAQAASTQADCVGDICILTAIVRVDQCDSAGKAKPYILRNSSHDPAGLEVDATPFDASGNIRLRADQNRPVLSTMVSPDESLTRIGVDAGISGGGTLSLVVLTRFTSNGPQALRADDPWLCGSGRNFWITIIQRNIDATPSPTSTPTVFNRLS